MATELPTASYLNAAKDDRFTTGFTKVLSGNLAADNGNGADQFGGPGFVLVNGTLLTSGETVTLPSGARLTVDSDLSFSYDQADAFADLELGATADDAFTYSVAAARILTPDRGGDGLAIPDAIAVGDINGDGFDDLYALGANRFIYGAPDWPAELTEADVQALYSDGYTSALTVPTTWKGTELVSEAGVGDVNGDGIDDFAVVSRERLTVLFGREGGFGGIVDIDDLDPSEGFIVVPDHPDQTGFGVVAAGDVNGDGYADIALTTEWPPFQFDEEEYETYDNYFIYGQSEPVSSPILISEFTASADSAGTHFGTDSEIVPLGDINDDGFDDVSGSRTEVSFYGGLWSTFYSLTFGAADFALEGPSNQVRFADDRDAGFPKYFAIPGQSGPIDIDGDGVNDYTIYNTLTETSQVLYGSPSLGQFDPSDPTAGQEFDTLPTLRSTPVSDGTGDVNGDGFEDLLRSSDDQLYLIFGDSDLGVAPTEVITEEATVTITVERGYGLDLSVAEAGNPLTGTRFDDKLTGSDNADTLFGAAGDDILRGGAGADELDGGAGSDTMVGGLGNDRYIVGLRSDVIVEAAGEGWDIVYSYASGLVLTDNVEALHLLGTASARPATPATIISSATNWRTICTARTETISSRAVLATTRSTAETARTTPSAVPGTTSTTWAHPTTSSRSAPAKDTTTSSRTRIRFSAPTSSGSSCAGPRCAGPVTTVPTRSSATRTTTRSSAARATTRSTAATARTAPSAVPGTISTTWARPTTSSWSAPAKDTTTSSRTRTRLLGTNVERLELRGPAVRGTGNDGENTIVGNAADNTLAGGAGDDTINGGDGTDRAIGGAGDDLYYVGSSDDVVVERAGEGYDQVIAYADTALSSNVERLELRGPAVRGTGNDGANTIIGSAADNELSGLAGNDTIVGGAGRDILSLGAGADVALFRAGDTGVGPGLRDIITDFVRGEDLADLGGIDADATAAGNQTFAFVGAGVPIGTGEIGYIVYGTTLVLSANTDDDAAMELQIQFDDLTTLTADDLSL